MALRRAALFAGLALLAGLPLATDAAALNRTTTLASKPTGIPDAHTAGVSVVAVSRDGTRVFLQTAQRLTPDDNDGGLVDVYERSGGTTRLVSAPTGVADPHSSGAFLDGTSADGSRVFFDTDQKL